MDNVITAVFGAMRTAKTAPRHQYDYGQYLKFSGLPAMPDAYEVHFANAGDTDALRVLSDGTPVAIPDEMLTTGRDIEAWVYVHTAAEDGETVYTAHIPVIKRARPVDYEPTPEEAGLVEQAIEALNRKIDVLDNANIYGMSVEGTTLVFTSTKEG